LIQIYKLILTVKNILYLILFELLFTYLNAFGIQSPDSLKIIDSETVATDSAGKGGHSSPADSIIISNSLDFVNKQDKVRKIADSISVVLTDQFKEKQINSQQLNLLSDLKREIIKTDDFIKHGIDTSEFKSELDVIENEYKLASESSLENEGTFFTVRNLTTSALLMKELLVQLDIKKDKALSYLTQLNQFRKTIDSLQTNSIVFSFAKDSALFVDYFTKLFSTAYETAPVDSALTVSIKTMNEFENRINELKSRIKSTEQKIISARNTLSENFTERETNDILSISESPQIFSYIIHLSFLKDKLILKYFFINNFMSILFMLLVFFILAYSVKKLKYHFTKPGLLNELSEESKLIIDFPLMTAGFIVIMIFEFIFSNPPIIFQGILWTIASLILSVLLHRYLSKKQFRYWIFLFLSFILTLTADLILGISHPERILLLLIAGAGIFAGVSALRKNIFHDKYLHFKNIILTLSVFFLTISVIANILGRYNISKLLITVSLFMLISAYLLYWTMILGIELLKLTSQYFKYSEDDNYINKIQRFSVRTPVALKIFLCAGWLILLIRNFHLYDYLTNKLFYYLNEERTIGNFTYTFEKILVFFSIILIATIISKIVAFIADSTDSANIQKSGQKGGLSNWMLLIRIGVMTTGVILAFAATGIQTDRIAIIIGSLGIGIGLGLQTIVNNLVSGVILAFEKPFRLGDKIEVGDRTGNIKEIGIRSSKLSTSDGAYVIIPNGDLLSKQVVNWTLRNSLKRSEVLLSLNYGSQLNDIKKILKNILESNEDIVKQPPPVVFIDNFSNSTADFILHYWTEIDKSEHVKSELMLNIDLNLKKSDEKSEA